MICQKLGVEQLKPKVPQKPNQENQRCFAGIRLPAEHTFAEESSP
jgi:hypothetical protein